MTEYLLICSLERHGRRLLHPWGNSPALQTQYEDDLLTLRKNRASDSPTRSRVTILTELSKLDDLQCSVTKHNRNVRQDYLSADGSSKFI
jgi:hypothetical protein